MSMTASSFLVKVRNIDTDLLLLLLFGWLVWRGLVCFCSFRWGERGCGVCGRLGRSMLDSSVS